MNKNIVILPCGDNSLHMNWLSNNQNFDLGLIYFGDSTEIFETYKKNSDIILNLKGQKWFLISEFLKEKKELLNNYEYFWFPDDDLMTDSTSINKLFELNHFFKLWLSQPTIDGYVSHEIERKVEDSILRFTNFVEIICPLMSKETLEKLSETFLINKSCWGLDFLWPKILEYPTNKIAIIDEVTVTHTKPVGGDYSRFEKKPIDELHELFQQYNLTWSQKVLSKINKT